MFAAAFLWAVPRAEIVVYSTGQRMAKRLMNLMASLLLQLPNAEERLKSHNNEELKLMGETKADIRVLACSPGTVKVGIRHLRARARAAAASPCVRARSLSPAGPALCCVKVVRDVLIISVNRPYIPARTREQTDTTVAAAGHSERAMSSRQQHPADQYSERFFSRLKRDFRMLRKSPRELWTVFALNLLSSFAYFACAYTLVLFLTDDYGFTDIDAGLW